MPVVTRVVCVIRLEADNHSAPDARGSPLPACSKPTRSYHPGALAPDGPLRGAVILPANDGHLGPSSHPGTSLEPGLLCQGKRGTVISALRGGGLLAGTGNLVCVTQGPCPPRDATELWASL